MHKVVARIEKEESNRIELFFERLNSLESLLLSIKEKSALERDSFLHENVMNDISITNKNYSNWWDRMVIKYSLEKYDIGKMYVDFVKNEIAIKE